MYIARRAGSQWQRSEVSAVELGQWEASGGKAENALKWLSREPGLPPPGSSGRTADGRARWRRRTMRCRTSLPTLSASSQPQGAGERRGRWHFVWLLRQALCEEVLCSAALRRSYCPPLGVLASTSSASTRHSTAHGVQERHTNPRTAPAAQQCTEPPPLRACSR